MPVLSIKYTRDKFGQRVQVGDRVEWIPTRNHAGIPARVAKCREDGLIEADVTGRGRMTLRPEEIVFDDTTTDQQLLRAQR